MSSKATIDARLQVGSIYILLFIRDQDLVKGFHWALYHHLTPHSGYKFNVRDIGAGWISDSAANYGIMKSFLLDGALRIGYCEPSDAKSLKWIDELDLTGPPPPYDVFTCRTWTLHCVRGLVQQGFVKCEDVDALEQEAKAWAALHHKSAHDGEMPRPVDDAKSCSF